jgi:hypothetical protein
MKTNMIMIMGTLTFALSLTCAAFAQTPARPCGPTATEIFHLRTECREMGKQFDKESEALVIRRPEIGRVHFYAAHYNPQTNRCYVEGTTILREDGRDTFIISLLHDAQSDEPLPLASTMRSYDKDGTTTFEAGSAGDGTNGNDHAAYLKAKAFIDAHMKEDRQ